MALPADGDSRGPSLTARHPLKLSPMDELLTQPIILGSRSPQRRELLKLLVPERRIVVAPPQNPDEQGFDGQRYRREIEQTLREIARAKNDDVVAQQSTPFAAVLTADTTILGFEEVFQAPHRPSGAFDDIGFDEATVNIAGQPHVLGQPPDDNWQSVVREWFERFYLGRTHTALTAVCITRSDGMQRELVVATDVHMVPLVTSSERQLLDWYLATGEPVGKAGGYAIQGAASIFVDEIRGSVSNVIGLPLRETLALMREMEVVA